MPGLLCLLNMIQATLLLDEKQLHATPFNPFLPTGTQKYRRKTNENGERTNGIIAGNMQKRHPPI